MIQIKQIVQVMKVAQVVRALQIIQVVQVMKVAKISRLRSSETVYANGGSSVRTNKYHRSPTVHITWKVLWLCLSQEAINRGYAACKKCY
ncbi:hypothetical protein Q5M85_10455 [Paraclostridium bifermentans]|nr:hypothetical protein [Paraclostridium bifermentans]